MPIYRGPGGSGDSSTDAYASQIAGYASTAITKAAEASASAASALAAETDAEAAAAAAAIDADDAAASAAAAEAVAGATATVNALTDVTITTPADNELLAYDSGTLEWINQTKTEAGFGTAATETVTTSATDTTAGRLLKVGDYGAGAAAGTYLFGRANILGTVSQSAGAPTGAVIERGSNANGEFVKFADGTLICRHSLSGISTAAPGTVNATWTFPSTPQATATSHVICDPFSALPGRFQASATFDTVSATVGVYDATGPSVSLGVRLTLVGRWFA